MGHIGHTASYKAISGPARPCSRVQNNIPTVESHTEDFPIGD